MKTLLMNTPNLNRADKIICFNNGDSVTVVTVIGLSQLLASTDLACKPCRLETQKNGLVLTV